MRIPQRLLTCVVAAGFACLAMADPENTAKPPYDDLLYLAGAGELWLDAVDDQGRPLLITALVDGSPVQVQQLLDRGYDTESTFSGFPALFYTVTDSCNPRKLHIMLEAGANIQRRDETVGSYPVHRAVQHQDLTCLEILLEYGASVKVVDDRGETPYFYALDHANQNALMRLWQLGVDPGTKTNEGIDLFYYAVILEQSALVRDLLILHLTSNPSRNSGRW